MQPVESGRNLAKIIAASSAGTLIEWYDFYIFGSLAFTIAPVFFPSSVKGADLLATLATFAIGFVVRPFGAVVFGYLGDRIGRKYTFMITLVLMGLATFAIGLLPGYAAIGWAAPTLLILLRLLQGLALGGEYGGAATYVAEHCPDGARGYWTSWIQTTATLGLFVSLGVIQLCRWGMPPEDFASWGWRIPFWVSLILVIGSWAIRRKMHESPLFQRMKSAGKASKNPFKESFADRRNLRLVLLALLGATAGQGVVWYTGQFYAMNFTKSAVGIDPMQAEQIVGVALLAATPFFIVFGALSDHIGRKGIMLSGCLLAVVTWYPIYGAMLRAGDVADPARFSIRAAEPAPGGERISFADGTTAFRSISPPPPGAEPSAPPVTRYSAIRFPSLTHGPAMTLTFLIFIQVLYVTMVYGPIAAFLVELFPTRIRYSSMSLPYHVGNGVFGGMVPLVGQWMIQSTGDKFAGLWYPMLVASITIVVGTLFLREPRRVRMHDETL